MLPWALRHYRAFADRIIVHCGGPTGCNRPPMSGVEYRAFDTGQELNDELARNRKNTCWLGTDADWVIVVDADELIWAKDGVRAVLERAQVNGAAVLRPHGFEMFSDAWLEAWAHPDEQLTELVQYGAPDDHWYAKPVVFSPRLVADSGFGIGAHESRPVLHDGRVLNCDRKWPFADKLALLHYKSIFGGMERIAARYDATRKRLSAVNVRCGYGNFKPGLEHAQEKRDLLLPHVRRVVE